MLASIGRTGRRSSSPAIDNYVNEHITKQEYRVLGSITVIRFKLVALLYVKLDKIVELKSIINLAFNIT